ncbi:MAG: ABC transporter ATP-binding protein [Limisphaerales bacterium]
MSDTVIKVENVSKLYRLGEVGTGTISHDFNRWWHKVRGKEDPYEKIGQTNDRTKKGDSDYAWALQDVSFDVKQGEVLGIIGRNGAGKSTLLKILSRVTTPTSGQIKIKGRIASLLEVGTGFNPELTGRDNIYLNGSILGMRKREIAKKFDEIVAFSEVERYIDTPVKRYSSGMYVRLAFAVAAHLEPEILICDEVLAVGDATFQQKCIGKMKDVSRGGRAVLFVSHNMASISALCSSAIILGDGKLVAKGSVDSCIERYFGALKTTSLTWERNPAEASKSPIHFTAASIEIEGSQPSITLHVDLQVKSVREHKPAFLAIDITDATGIGIMQAIPTLECVIKDEPAVKNFKISIQLPPMVPGNYSVTLWMGPHNSETYDEKASVVSFEIVNSPTKGRSYPHSRDHGFVVPTSKLVLQH